MTRCSTRRRAVGFEKERAACSTPDMLVLDARVCGECARLMIARSHWRASTQESFRRSRSGPAGLLRIQENAGVGARHVGTGSDVTPELHVVRYPAEVFSGNFARCEYEEHLYGVLRTCYIKGVGQERRSRCCLLLKPHRHSCLRRGHFHSHASSPLARHPSSTPSEPRPPVPESDEAWSSPPPEPRMTCPPSPPRARARSDRSTASPVS